MVKRGMIKTGITAKKGMAKRAIILGFIAASLFLSGCSALQNINFSSWWYTLRNLLWNVCNLSDQDLAVLAKLAITFLSFIVPLFLISGIPAGGSVFSSEGGGRRKIAFILAVFIAFSTFLFIPPSVVLFVGTSYAAIVGWVLMFAPLIGGLYLWMRLHSHLGRFHWIALLVIGMVLLIVYGYAFSNWSSVGVC